MVSEQPRWPTDDEWEAIVESVDIERKIILYFNFSGRNGGPLAIWTIVLNLYEEHQEL